MPKGKKDGRGVVVGGSNDGLDTLPPRKSTDGGNVSSKIVSGGIDKLKKKK